MDNARLTPLDTKTIDRDIARGGTFFHGIATVRDIAAILALWGYTGAEHRQGLGYFSTLLGFRSPEQAVPPPTIAATARAKLDDWDGPNITIARAALTRQFPEQATYLVGDLSNKTGYDAVLNVMTFVERATALRDGTDPNRADTRDQDRAAIELLGRRNVFTPAIEADLRANLADATSTAEALPAGEVKGELNYQEAAVAFHAWLADWRETARAVITRRDYLIRLGLAQRRSAKAAASEEDEGEVVE